MIPVYQTRYGYPAGNCWEACLASILEIPLSEIPDGRQRGFGRTPWQETAAWVFREHQHILVWMPFENADFRPLGFERHYVLGGLSRSGVPHAVVAKGGRVVHDPGGGECGLVSVFGAELLIPVSEGVELPYAAIPERYAEGG